MEKVENKIICRNAVIAFGITVLSFFVIGKFFTLYYGVNDDMMFRNILGGLFTGQPDAHTYYESYAISYIIRGLYLVNSTIKWYELFLVSCMAVSMFFVLFRVLELLSEASMIYDICAVVIIELLFLNAILEIQWNMAAGFLAVTAIFLLGTIQDYKGWWMNFLQYLFIVGFLAIAFGIRRNMVYLALPFAGLLCLYKFFYKERVYQQPRELKKLGVIVASFVILLGGIWGVNRTVYSGTKEWKEYKDYNVVRGQLVDYYGFPNYEENQKLYEDLDISKELYEIAKNDYNFAMDNHLTTDQLKVLAKKGKEIAKEKKEKTAVFYLTRYYDATVSNSYAIVNIFLLLLFLFCVKTAIKNDNIGELLCIAAGITGSIAIWLYLSYEGRLPYRVGYPLKLFELFFLLSVFFMGNMKVTLKKPGRSSQIVLIICMCLLVLLQYSKASYNHQLRREYNEAQYAWLEYCEDHKENLYFKDFYSFDGYKEALFSPKNGQNSNAYIGLGGWMFGTPLYREALLEYGITDVSDAILNKDNVYVVYAEKRKRAADRLERYFKSTGINVKKKVVDKIECENEQVFLVYKFNIK